MSQRPGLTLTAVMPEPSGAMSRVAMVSASWDWAYAATREYLLARLGSLQFIDAVRCSEEETLTIRASPAAARGSRSSLASRWAARKFTWSETSLPSSDSVHRSGAMIAALLTSRSRAGKAAATV